MSAMSKAAVTSRINPTFSETNWWELSEGSNFSGVVTGVDEVGRGALFGPVVAAAVILPHKAYSELITAKIKDSKKLSATRRNKLFKQICYLAIDWQIGFASAAEIDNMNILQASLLAMSRSIEKLNTQPDLCLIDGNQRLKNLHLSQETIVKGDERSLSIAAASIVAKIWRDELISKLAYEYPLYDLENNKGYGSKKHLLALKEYGPSPLHRFSFRPCQNNIVCS